MSVAWLSWSLFFGVIGLGLFVYGRKQRSPVPLVCGLILMVFPYFVSNIPLLVAIGLVVLGACYFIRV